MTRTLKVAALAGALAAALVAVGACVPSAPLPPGADPVRDVAPSVAYPGGVSRVARTTLLSPAEQAISLDDLMRADRAFSSMAQTVGVAEAFAEYMDADGKVLGAGDAPAVGAEAIFALFAAFPDEALFSWSPVEGFVAASGDMGVTWGTYDLGFPDEDGNVVMDTGRYLTVWRRDEAGRWRGFLDIGT